MSIRALLAAALCCALARPLSAQDATMPMQLNRQGQWAEAARVADRLLEGSELTPPQRCEVRYSRAYAFARTARVEQGRAEAAALIRECASVLPESSWVFREAAKLLPSTTPPAVRRDDGWLPGDAAALGVNPSALEDHRRLCETTGADACLVAVEGRIVQAWYGPGYREPMHTMSSVKSWTALLAGILIADGRLGLDDPVARWIPEWTAGAEAGVTVRHLLTMTSGLPASTDLSGGVGTVSDKNAFAFGLRLVARPGERWAYSNEGAYLLSPILERAAGQPLERFAEERLFRPLGMLDTGLMVDSTGNAWTHADANTSLRDFAKICQLILDGGVRGGTRIVDATWLRTITTPIPQNRGYGMLWYVEGSRVWATQGFRNTDCYAFPEQRVVIARIQNLDNPAQTAFSPAALGGIVTRLRR